MDQEKQEGFRRALEEGGLEGGLWYLNDLVPHRFTALYRLSEGVLKNIVLIDKLGEATPDVLQEIPLEDSLCQFAIRDRQFKTTNSPKDQRLDGHPLQGVVMAYHGVPVMNKQGVLFGSLCHLDEKKHSLSDADFELLRYAATVIAAELA